MPLERKPEGEELLSERDAREYAAIPRDAETALFAAFLGPAPAGRLADLGSGAADIPAGLCRLLPGISALAVESSPVMLRLAEERLPAAGPGSRLKLLPADARHTGLPGAGFDWIISNNFVHHLADPAPLFAEIARLAAPGAGLLIRDLRRPDSEEELEAIAAHCPESTPRQRELLRSSLRAALSAEEARNLALAGGLAGFTAERAGPRHWELRRPRALKV